MVASMRRMNGCREVAKIAKIAKIAKSSERCRDTASHRRKSMRFWGSLLLAAALDVHGESGTRSLRSL